MKITQIFFFFISTILPSISIALDTITSTQPLTQNQTISSSDEAFEMGFFSFSGESNKWYIGIWYKNTPEKTIVWVANRDIPLKNPSGILTISEDGNLVILDDGKNPIWSSNLYFNPSNTVAQLLDSGNFVLRYQNDSNPQNFLWQGFDHPTDTLLTGMKLGWDAKTGINREITSWKSKIDPSTGDYKFVLNINTTFPEGYLIKNGESILYRSGPWNGVGFSGVPEMKPLGDMSFTFVNNKDEIYYTFALHNSSLYSRLFVDYSGMLQRITCIKTIVEDCNLFWYAPKDQCDNFKECGDFGICDTNSAPICKCLKGFKPKDPQAWYLRDGSKGCIRDDKLDCKNDGFLTLHGMKLPESINVFVDESMTLEECKKMCLENCSCMAYSNSNINAGGSGCAIWSSELVDLRQYAVQDGGQNLYVRVAAYDSDNPGDLIFRNTSDKRKRIAMIAGIVLGSVAVLFCLIVCFVWRKKQSIIHTNNIEHRASQERSQIIMSAMIPNKRESSFDADTEEIELPLYDFSTIVVATDHFSENNKLGQGGFGIVYKGLLFEGEEVAVKRLSKSSYQGIEEFKNEIKMIARLQHRNLVRLIGSCVEMEEKILIYEYMANKSLDSMLFDKKKSMLLNWQRRFNIICGISRGLLYLHQDSRFRIIHRDLKASNILLDSEMNPKISDFGMARIFSVDQIDANTKRVVGTYGYMAPEYAMDGVFSEKSDVFSFGVLVLEIVSGIKNRGFYHVKNHLNLLAYAWRLWTDKRIEELTDSVANEISSRDEVKRCIQVGLLCVQEHAEDRPNMANVVLMLGSGSVQIPQPKQPGFSMRIRHSETDSYSNKLDESVNQITVTILDPR